MSESGVPKWMVRAARIVARALRSRAMVQLVGRPVTPQLIAEISVIVGAAAHTASQEDVDAWPYDVPLMRILSVVHNGAGEISVAPDFRAGGSAMEALKLCKAEGFPVPGNVDVIHTLETWWGEAGNIPAYAGQTTDHSQIC